MFRRSMMTTVRTTDFAVPAEVEELLSRLQNVVEAHPLD